MPNEEELKAPMGVPTQAPTQAPNPTVESEKDIKKPEDKPKDKKAENELLESMMFSPSSSDADPTVTIDKTTDEDKETTDADNIIKVLESGDGQISEKYRKELLDKALKDPTSIEVETPKGWMTVKDAIGEGFDLSTGEFSNEPIPKVDWEGEISKLDPREQETIRNLTQPGRRQAGPSKKGFPEEGGDVIPGSTGEPIPPTAGGVPVPEGALGKTEVGGTELPLGGV
jgi:hypothetical protein